MRVDLWSSGGGVQSTAIAVLILTGRLPKPDLAVIADTEREKQSTWDYLDAYTRPALRSIGVEVHRIKKSDWEDNTRGGLMLMPLFTDQNGTLAKMPTFCSNMWKRDCVRRFASRQYPDAQFRVWMGISYDEPRRIRPTIGKWQTWYPLYEQRIRRNECLRIVEEYGWPAPPRSSCWMCPNRGAQEWATMQRESPEEFAKAVALEAELREIDNAVYLHQYGVPLAEAVAMTPPTNPTLFDTERCDSGQCFV